MFMDSVSSATIAPVGTVEAETATLASLYRAKALAQSSLNGNMLAPLIAITAFVSLHGFNCSSLIHTHSNPAHFTYRFP